MNPDGQSNEGFLDEDVAQSNHRPSRRPQDVAGVLKNSPIQYMHSALNNGASRRTQERIRKMWLGMKKKGAKKTPVEEKLVPKITSHLTKDQFIINPGFKQHNNDLRYVVECRSSASST